MLRYVIGRVFIFIPTLIVITLLGFIISVNAPGNPVERMVAAPQNGGEMGSQSVNQIEQKKYWTKKLGLDLPIFYFSLSSLSRPDTLYRIFNKNDREALDRLIEQYGNWQEIQTYYKEIQAFYRSLIGFVPDTSGGRFTRDEVLENLNDLKFESLALASTFENRLISAKLGKLNQKVKAITYLQTFQLSINTIEQKYALVRSSSTTWKNYIPRLNFYTKNQYHRWIFGDGNWLTGSGSQFSKGLIRGDFGISYITKQPISDVIASKIGWSLFFTLISVILAYLVSIPLGVKAAANRGSMFDRSSSLVLFFLYSMPSFWVATILLMTFANPDVLLWFPASGVKPPGGYLDGASFFEKIKMSFPYLVLPAICYTYSSFAFLSRTMRVSMIEIVGQDYIRTARAKGLPENKVIWKHAFRNSLLPIVTVFANIFPLAISGSVILESIFTIPGMGSESVLAIQTQNYPMIIAILTITGVLTLVGYLVSDVLYAVVDPRISYSEA